MDAGEGLRPDLATSAGREEIRAVRKEIYKLRRAKASGLAATDRDAPRAVSEWIKDFVAKPHRDLGRAGTVCPFVPGSLERRTLWFAPEKIAELDVPEVVELMDDYKRLILEKAPLADDDAIYKTIIVVFTDLPAERAGPLFTDVLGQLADAS